MQLLVQRNSNAGNYVVRVFPAVAPLMPKLAPATITPDLATLLSRTTARPDLFAWLHGRMVGHWPTNDAAIAALDSDAIFQEAATVLEQTPSLPRARSILTSLQDMIDRGFVRSERADQLVNVACVVWSSHPSAAMEVFSRFNIAPRNDRTALLGEELDSLTDESIEALRHAWSRIASLLSSVDSTEVARLVLSVPPHSSEESPDLALTLWVDAQEEGPSGLLGMLVRDEGLNDEQRARVWRQVVRLSPELNNSFFTVNLPEILAPASGDRTRRTVFDDQEAVDRHFPSLGERYALAKLLLSLLVDSPSQETQNRLAQWIKRLDVQDVLMELNNMPDIVVETVQLLQDHFGRAKPLGRLRTKLDRN